MWGEVITWTARPANISKADDNFTKARPPALGERSSPTCLDTDHQRKMRRPSPGGEFFIPGPANTWATPSQFSGQNTGLMNDRAMPLEETAPLLAL
jgi:hypothetical protein